MSNIRVVEPISPSLDDAATEIATLLGQGVDPSKIWLTAVPSGFPVSTNPTVITQAPGVAIFYVAN